MQLKIKQEEQIDFNNVLAELEKDLGELGE